MAEVVLDASALLALLNDEPGAAVVAIEIPGSAISALNLSEVVAKLSDAGMPEAAIRQALQGLPLDVIPFDQEQAYEAGLLRTATRSAGLSLGDRGCLSLARRLGLPALTADRTWQALAIGAVVRVIR
ncbi:MAG: PIN domain-containing protein [Dehalococcoidia bacterium]|nr:PIN domain-containing protein [Dehalococcoidia bacterium]